MPTYEYKCDNCGHQFEIYQSMKDDKLTKCPVCGKEALKRLIGTGGGVIFKGSGFYLTDYKNKPAEKSSSSTEKSKTPDATSKTESSTSSDTKKTSDTTSDTTKSEKKSSAKKPDKT